MELDVIRLQRLLETENLNDNDVHNQWVFEIEDLVSSLPLVKQQSINDTINKLKTYSSSIVRDRIRVQGECVSLIRGFLKSLLHDTANTESLERIDGVIEMAQQSGILQAVEHLKQAKKQLIDSSDERARKDAVRDCASAMEAVIKILGNEYDIKHASKKLSDSGLWGLEYIVKDGNAMQYSVTFIIFTQTFVMEAQKQAG